MIFREINFGSKAITQGLLFILDLDGEQQADWHQAGCVHVCTIFVGHSLEELLAFN